MRNYWNILLFLNNYLNTSLCLTNIMGVFPDRVNSLGVCIAGLWLLPGEHSLPVHSGSLFPVT